jgi:serine/threonine protein kinase/Tfp pilus assembly protein PilF
MMNEADGLPPGEDRTGEEPQDDRTEKIARILATCSDRLNAGGTIDREKLLAENPDLSRELGMALDALGEVASCVDPEPTRPAFGDFRDLRQVGRGGMGIVYQAWQVSMDRRVALKVLTPAHVANRKALARFELEAKAAGRLQHPNIVAVYGKGIEAGAPYYIMEYVEGETLDLILDRLRPSQDIEPGPAGRPAGGSSLLSRLLRSSGRSDGAAGSNVPGGIAIPPEARPARDPTLDSSFDAAEVNLKSCLRVAEAFAEVADALQYAHGKGIIHRDLKPSNLILDQKGKLRILDFGLAHLEGQESLTLTGEFVGTPLYTSPEQALAHRASLDHRTDIYSLGATLYELLARRPPFKGRDYKETLAGIVLREPPHLRTINPRIPKTLETIVLKCLRKDPEDRYGTAEALAQDLRRFIRGDPIEARPEPPIVRLVRRAWQAKWRIAAAACAVLLCASTAVLVHRGIEDARAVKERSYAGLVLDGAVRIELGRPVARRADSPRTPALRRPAAGSSQPGIFDLAYAEAQEVETGAPDPVEEAEAALRDAIAIFPEKPEARYHRARALAALGRDGEALAEIERALASDPGFAPVIALREALSGRAGEEGEKGREAGPAGLRERARGSTPSSDWSTAWLRAHRSAARKDWRDAVDAFTEILELDPVGGRAISDLLGTSPAGREAFLGSTIEALLGRGRASLERGYLNQAIEDFSAARWLWPDLFVPGLLLGKTYFIRGEKEWAEKIFSETYKASDHREEVALKIAGLYLALDDPERGLGWTEKAGASAARERVRSALLGIAGRLEESLAVARAAVDLDRRDPLSIAFLGEALRKLKKLDEAAAEHEKAIAARSGTPAFHNNLGLVQLDKGDPDRAAAEFGKAIEIDGKYLKARLGLAEALTAKGQVREAALALEEAGRAVHSPAVCMQAGKLLAAKLEDADPRRKHIEAAGAYRKAVGIDPRYWPARYNLIMALRDAGEGPMAEEAGREALPVMEKALEEIKETAAEPRLLRASYFAVLDLLARLASQGGRAEEARAHTKKALEVQKEILDLPGATYGDENRYAWTLLTCLPEDLRSPAEAIAHAERAVTLSRQRDPEALDTLALAHFLKGDPGKALELGRKARALLPDSPQGERDRKIAAEIEEHIEKYRSAMEESTTK